MSYWSMFVLSQNVALYKRVLMCAIEQGIPQDDAPEWVSAHNLEIATAPGWGAAWDSALVPKALDSEQGEDVITEMSEGPIVGVLVRDDDDLGRDGAVITDAMILAEVQRVMEVDDGE